MWRRWRCGGACTGDVDSSDVASSLDSLALLYQHSSQWGKAEPLLC